VINETKQNESDEIYKIKDDDESEPENGVRGPIKNLDFFISLFR